MVFPLCLVQKIRDLPAAGDHVVENLDAEKEPPGMVKKTAPPPAFGVSISGLEYLVVPGERPGLVGVLDGHEAENEGVVEGAGGDAVNGRGLLRFLLGIGEADEAAELFAVHPGFFEGHAAHLESVLEHAGVASAERLVHAHP